MRYIPVAISGAGFSVVLPNSTSGILIDQNRRYAGFDEGAGMVGVGDSTVQKGFIITRGK